MGNSFIKEEKKKSPTLLLEMIKKTIKRIYGIVDFSKSKSKKYQGSELPFFLYFSKLISSFFLHE